MNHRTWLWQAIGILAFLWLFGGAVVALVHVQRLVDAEEARIGRVLTLDETRDKTNRELLVTLPKFLAAAPVLVVALMVLDSEST